MALVTIVIPAYNAAAFITRAVETALAQTYSELEVIVIDDGSVDETAAVARKTGCDDPRLRIIRRENGGVSAARNTGLDNATGAWVAPLDADDAFAPTRIARLFEIANQSAADLVADNLLVTGPDGSSTHAFPDARMSDPREVALASFISSDRPRHGFNSAGFIKPLMRRDFLERHRLRYPVGLSMSEDFHFYSRCLLHGARLRYVPDALYLYTYRAASLSHGDDHAIITQLRRANQLLVEEARELGKLDAVEQLQHREVDTARWIGALDFERAVGRLDLANALRQFVRLPSKRYGVYRALAVTRYNVLRALGRTPRPRTGRG